MTEHPLGPAIAGPCDRPSSRFSRRRMKRRKDSRVKERGCRRIFADGRASRSRFRGRFRCGGSRAGRRDCGRRVPASAKSSPALETPAPPACTVRRRARATLGQKTSDLLFPTEEGGFRAPCVLNKPFAVVSRAIGLPFLLTQKGVRPQADNRYCAALTQLSTNAWNAER
jgi:hypothetical protein